jgi:hypothetical protein
MHTALLIAFGLVAAPPAKTTCEHTGNAYFFKVCAEKTKRCWWEYGIQAFMYNGEKTTKRFVFRCTLRYGHRLRKKQVRSMPCTIKPGVNCLGGPSFRWCNILVDKAKGRYRYRCTCTVTKPVLRVAARGARR